MGIQGRGLKPAAELAANRPHGERLRYVGGCRCEACRKANSAYENARQKARRAGEWNGIVPADKARAHIKALSRQGVGRKAVAAASDVGETAITEIRARRTWMLIDELVEEGYTYADLAQRMGYKTPRLQFGRERVTVRTAARVEHLHRKLTT